MAKKMSRRRKDRIQARTDRRARFRALREARREELELSMMRGMIAHAHADMDTAQEAEEIVEERGTLSGWRDDLAWRRHYDDAFNWTEGWNRVRLEAELQRIQDEQEGAVA